MFEKSILGGENVADALLEFLLKLQLEVTVDLLFALGQCSKSASSSAS